MANKIGKKITVITSWDDEIVCTKESLARIGLVRDGERMGSIMVDEFPHKDDDKGFLKFITKIEDWMIDNNH